MAEPAPAPRRISPATIALVLAGVLAIVAIGVAIFRSSGDDAPAATAATNGTAPQPDNPNTMIAAMRESLRQNPDNHEGWYQLGLAYRGSGRFDDAVAAFRRAMELAPNNADYTAYLAEAMLLVGGDRPPPEAERLLHRTIELQPGNPQALYYLATLKDLRGDHRGAVNDLVALLRSAPPGAPWLPQVREAATNIASQNLCRVKPNSGHSRPNSGTDAVGKLHSAKPAGPDGAIDGCPTGRAPPPESARCRRLDPDDALTDGAERPRRRPRRAQFGSRRL
jgi:cytochrome c-type biogenesis protein CcmH